MNGNKALGMMALMFAVTVFAGCPKDYVKGGKVQNTLKQDMDAGKFVEAIGIGAADPSLPTVTQKRSLSRDAAIVKAQYEMLSVVKGVEIEGGITVERAMEKDSTLEARLKQVIKGAEIVKTEYTKDDGAVVTLRIPKKRLSRLMGINFK